MEGEVTAKEENDKILNFYSGADILVHDAQYTALEYSKHLGWGHSSYEYAIKAASSVEIKKLVFFHHDPRSTDEQLQSLEEQHRNEAVGNKLQMELIMAREGLVIEA